MVPVAKSKFVEIGRRVTGFALKQRSTQKGVSEPTYEFEVTEFVEGSLDPNLFEIPSDYKNVTTLNPSARSSRVIGNSPTTSKGLRAAIATQSGAAVIPF